MRKLAMLAAIAGCYTSAKAPAPTAQQVVVEQPRHVRTAADPLGFLPIDSELVAYVDVTQLRSSVLWERFEPRVMAATGPTFAQFRAACGFDVLPMVKRVALGMRDLDAPHPNAVLVVRGIERGRMMACVDKAIAADPRIAQTDHGVVTVLTGAGDPPTHFAFADASTLVLVTGPNSTTDLIRSVLDSGSPLRSSETFVELYSRIDPARAAWFFVNGNAKLLGMATAMGLKPRALYGSFDLSTGLAMKITLRLDDATQAQTLLGLVQGQTAAAKALVERFDVTAEDADVIVDAAVTDDQAQMISNLVWP